MKPFFIFTAVFFLVGGLFSIFAQDVIILKNGDEIKAKVLEISSLEIKYKRFDNLEGPTVVIPAANVLMIQYENGTREIINAETRNSISDNSQSERAIDRRGAAIALNATLGLGIGSYVQGDVTGGTIALIGDILGWGMIIIGAANPIVENYGMYATVEVSPLVYIGAIVLSGVRIFELIRPFTYANKFSSVAMDIPIGINIVPVSKNDLGVQMVYKLSF